MIIALGTTPTISRSMIFSKITIDGVNRTQSVHEYAAGKSVNASRVLHTLGDDVLATGFLGGDRGRFIRADLDQIGIKHDFIEVEPVTRLCTTAIDQAAGTATELIEESRPIPNKHYDQLIDKLGSLLNRATMLVLSGSLPPDAPADFYARCVKIAGDRVRVVLDAVGAPLIQALPHRPFLIKPNQSEVGRTLGIATDTENALRDGMRKLIEHGATWVAVTRGPSGTLLSDGHSFWSLNTPSVKVISAIGSGDAFAAGLASGLSKGQTVPQACRLAVACGSANAMTPHSGHVDLPAVKSLIEQVHLAQV